MHQVCPQQTTDLVFSNRNLLFIDTASPLKVIISETNVSKLQAEIL